MSSLEKPARKRASSTRVSTGAVILGAGGGRAASAKRNVPEPDDFEGFEVAEIPGLHVRCDFEPLETAGDTEDPPLRVRSENDTATNSNKMNMDVRPSTSTEPVPALPRYCIAETRNCNCWSEPPHASFNVRGATYLRDKKPKKVPSGPYLFRAIGADLILTDASSGPGTALVSNYSTILGGRIRSAPTFIVNFVCPWGLIVNYYEIPELYLPYLRVVEASRAHLLAAARKLKPYERAMAHFLMGSNKDRDSMLKLIPIAVEGPLVVMKMVRGKPAIIGKRLPTKYTYCPADDSRGLKDCFEVDLDVTATDSVGRSACNMSRRYMSSVTVDLGLVIEGRTTEELPERMLGCIRLHRIDALEAATLPSLLS